MTDSRLQELKRAWEASGSVEDEAAYLRERVRVGDLTQERLELAAKLGQAAAVAATGRSRAARQSVWDLCDEIAASDWDAKLLQATLRRVGLALLRAAIEKTSNTKLGTIEPSTLLGIAEAAEAQGVGRTPIFDEACEEFYQADPDGVLVESDKLYNGLYGYFVEAYDFDLNAARAGINAYGRRSDSGGISVIRRYLAPWLLQYADPLLDLHSDP